MASPTVPDAEVQKVSFASSAAPVTAVTVFKGRAQITRKVAFSAATKIGLHEVELTGLPSSHFVEERSLAVKGSGHCTILDFSFLNTESEAEIEGQRKAAEALETKKRAVIDALKKKREETDPQLREMEAAKRKSMEALKQEHAHLGLQVSRNQSLGQMARRVMDRATSTFACSIGPPAVASAGKPGAAAAAATQDSMGFDGVTKALDWWEKKAMHIDEECHRLGIERQRVTDAMANLESDHASAVGVLRKLNNSVVADIVETRTPRTPPENQRRVVVTVDVEELQCPIELEVSYMTSGATWSPAYDLRVDTQTDSMSCTYYGRVSQRTSEDWEGVALKLSTAEPSARSTPPPLGTKTVSIKNSIPPPPPLPPGGGSFGVPMTILRGMPTHSGAGLVRAGGMGMRPPAPGAAGFSAPPPPPEAKTAVAQVEGGSGGLGAVTFVVDKPASIKKNGETKKFSVGVLQLNTDVVHYIVPSKEPAAYLQAKATNNTDYMLLESEDVSVFFDNSFVTKTNLASVSPGESFQTFLGTDPAVKVKVAPPRKTAKQKGLFGKVDHVNYTQSTSISNTKKVPVTCVLVDALPRSTDEIIKVTLQQPAQVKVSEAAEAVNDEMLVDVALDKFGGDGGVGAGGDAASTPSTTAPKTVKTSVAGVAKGPMNHLAWVVNIAPTDDILVPLEYTVEWPIGKEVVFSDNTQKTRP